MANDISEYQGIVAGSLARKYGWVRLNWGARAETAKNVNDLAAATGAVVELLARYAEAGEELSEDEMLVKLGDVLAHVCQLANIHGWNLGDVIRASTADLQKRFPNNG